jgi:hypothetical protein
MQACSFLKCIFYLGCHPPHDDHCGRNILSYYVILYVYICKLRVDEQNKSKSELWLR